ncbi:MAG: type II toxin-antitoxin system HicA family toxin [Flavobacteriales bacterium]|nr:type II toxin-antitoxin system HicA family toxin [Flavobacteriales bacterium]MBK9539317.1 type II toxin-antitoxin system HicA family toxin [Flavobacteriales bacterium]
MDKLPVISGKDLLRLLQKMGFVVVRINGSHHRLRHADGRVTTVPVHGNADLPKGLLRKIIREDLKLTVEVFTQELERL